MGDTMTLKKFFLLITLISLNTFIMLMINNSDSKVYIKIKKNKNRKTSLHTASTKRYSEIVKYLIKSGADVNSKGADGMTPLIYAIKNNFDEVVSILLQAGAIVDIVDNIGATALMAAAFYG